MFAKYRHLQWVLILLFVVASNADARWQQISELPMLRVGKAAAAVRDEIYIIGGFNPDENLGGGAPALSRVDVYDTLTNTWHAAADIPTPRIASQAAVFSSEIYVFGGYNRTAVRGEKWKKIVEAYDSRTNTWVRKRDMPTLRRNFGTAVVDGEIYVIGGSVHDKQIDKQVTTNLVEVYDPLTEKWEKRVDMPTKRARIVTAVVDDKIYVIGGEDFLPGLGLIDRFLIRIEEYNPKTNQWRRVPDLPTFKFDFATVAIDNEIYIIGGYSLNDELRLGFTDAVDVYNPTGNKWHPSVPILTAKLTTAAVVNGTIYLFGGLVKNRRIIAAVEALDTGFRAVDAKGKLSTRWGELKKAN